MHLLSAVFLVLLYEGNCEVDVPSVCDLDPCTCNSTTKELTCMCNENLKGMVTGELPVDVKDIHVFGCNLTVRENALMMLSNLRKIELRGIPLLKLEPFAFQVADGSKVSIEVTDSHIPFLPQYSFTGFARDISIHQTSIGKVETQSFTDLERLKKLNLRGIDIGSLPKRAISNITTDFVYLVGNTIKTLEYEAIQLKVRYSAIVKSNNFGTLHSWSIGLGNIKKDFQFSENYVKEIHAEAISLQLNNKTPKVISNVFIKVFSNAFSGIHTSRLNFENNKFDKLEKDSFKFDSQLVSFTNFTFYRKCTCDPDSWLLPYMPILTPLYPDVNTSFVYSWVTCDSEEGEEMSANEGSTQAFCSSSSSALLIPTALYALVITAVVLVFLISIVSVTIINKKRDQLRMKRNNSLLQHPARSSDLGTFPLERRF